MSYDIAVYERAFLLRALAENLGDWTGAPRLPQEALERVVELASEAGFEAVPIDPAFREFSREQGLEPGQEFNLDTTSHLAQLTVFPAEIAFTVPYAPRGAASITLCSSIARTVAREHSLGYYDPQTGEAG